MRGAVRDGTPVVGRFAPSPSGPLHAGSLAAAMASWLDARARQGRWLLRIEDLDGPRTVVGAEQDILSTLATLGFLWDEPIARQSTRGDLYRQAFARLKAAGRVYPCACSRREIETMAGAPDPEASRGIYPGTCRGGLPLGRSPRAWRMRVDDRDASFRDRAAGLVHHNLARDDGDFVVRRADGVWAYQLAVVVDDAQQGVTDVVRGADLLDSTPRQRWLQEALGLPLPTTLHVPMVLDEAGHKLGKSRGATALDTSDPLAALDRAARHLELVVDGSATIARFWEAATSAWAARWPA